MHLSILSSFIPTPIILLFIIFRLIVFSLKYLIVNTPPQYLLIADNAHTYVWQNTTYNKELWTFCFTIVPCQSDMPFMCCSGCWQLPSMYPLTIRHYLVFYIILLEILWENKNKFYIKVKFSWKQFLSICRRNGLDK